MHVIKLDGYNATVDNGEKLELGTFDSYGEEQLQIVKAPNWENLSVIATFNPPYKKPVQAVVDSVTGVVKVPKEATADSYGVGTIVFVGLADGVQRISADVEYIVRKHSNASGTEPAEPTPDLLQQVLTLSKDAQTAAKNAVKDAAAAKANADKAQADAEKAQQAAENAAADAAKAGPYAEAARAAQEAAESARDEAIAAQQAAENAAAAAAASKSAADTLAAEAARAAKAAEDSKAAANNSAYFAGENATAAQQAAGTATAAANDAGQSASDAAASKAAAETAAKAAQDAQTAAAAAKAEAVKAQGAAQTAAKSAQDAQATAEKVRDDAKTAQKSAEAARDTAAKSAEAAAKSEANAKQSADTLAESVENVVANTAAVAELKQQVKNITPDDSSIGEKPWSSKNIVDMLCPPLEESGNPVVCYPVAGYPLGVKAKWEPAQEGSGTPSPENIRSIKGRDSVTVERCGENLLDISAFSLDVDKDNRTYQTKVQQLIPPGKYTLKLTHTNPNSGLGMQVFTRNGNKVSLISGQTFNLDGICDSIYFYISNVSGNADSIKDIMLIPSTATATTTTYTPYTGQTNTLTLPETVYGGEVDAVTGEGQETWRLLNNPSSYNYYEGTAEGGWRQSEDAVAWFLYNPKFFPKEAKVLSNIFNVVSNIANTVSPYTIGGKNNYIAFRLPRSVAATSNDVKNWLASNGVEIAFKPITQTPFTATGAQPIPALAGTNTVLTDADSATVTGRAAPVKRIEDLEAAVASIN